MALNRLLNPLAEKRPWYKILAMGNAYNYFAKATATGSVAIDKLLLGGTTCTRFSTNVDLEKAKLSLTNVRGNLLGRRSRRKSESRLFGAPTGVFGHGRLRWHFVVIDRRADAHGLD